MSQCLQSRNAMSWALWRTTEQGSSAPRRLKHHGFWAIVVSKTAPPAILALCETQDSKFLIVNFTR